MTEEKNKLSTKEMNMIFSNALKNADFSYLFKPRHWTFMYRIKFGTVNLKKIKIPILQ